MVPAIIDAPDASTWSGQRDRVLFALLYNTGARVSEVISLRRADLFLDSSRSVQLTGKGRKQRGVPLWKSTAKRLREWIASENPGLGISIGEWNFGAEEHMSGGLAVAEALGRFGALGLKAAFY